MKKELVIKELEERVNACKLAMETYKNDDFNYRCFKQVMNLFNHCLDLVKENTSFSKKLLEYSDNLEELTLFVRSYELGIKPF